MPEVQIEDHELQHYISFILDRLQLHQLEDRHRNRAFYLGINGVQGAGKTFLASSLAETLSRPPHCLPTIVLSIDDFYLPHELQTQLASSHPDNPLIQHRGQPSTHDLLLALSCLSSLREGKKTHIPRYDKSAYSGEGDRVSQKQWTVVNNAGDEMIRVVILEGWCVGFQALDTPRLQGKWEEAVAQREYGPYRGRLGWNRLEDVEFVNEALKGYDAITKQLDAMIHINAEHLEFVYEWRLEQEAALRRAKGTGMSDDQVIKFVSGYYPAYELYTDSLLSGVFGEKGKGRQLKVTIGRTREVKGITKL